MPIIKRTNIHFQKWGISQEFFENYWKVIVKNKLAGPALASYLPPPPPAPLCGSAGTELKVNTEETPKP